MQFADGKILAEARESNEQSTTLDRIPTSLFANLFPLGDELEYEPMPEQSVAAVAARDGVDPWALMYDLLLGTDVMEFLLRPLLNFGRGSYDGLHDMMLDPASVQGLGDGGAHSSIVCDASMTTYLLTHWVRDRTRGPRLALEYAVKRLTQDPAQLYALSDRGVLAPGKRADVNVIDLERLELRYPELVNDLPAGAGRLVQRSDGYVATLRRLHEAPQFVVNVLGGSCVYISLWQAEGQQAKCQHRAREMACAAEVPRSSAVGHVFLVLGWGRAFAASLAR